MSITGTSCHRGTASILGTLIFVGIIFTSFIPMMLVMSQADIMYDTEKHELGIREHEKAIENLDLYVIPEALDSSNVEVTIFNDCAVLVRVVSLWINDIHFPMDIIIPSLSEELLGTYELDLIEGAEYDIRATTDRGNVYVANDGILSVEDGEWLSETLGIRLILPSRPGKGSRTNLWLNELKVTIINEEDITIYDEYSMYWAISASENFFEVESAENYNVIIYIWCKAGGGYPEKHWEEIYDDFHSITWPTGDPVIELKFAIDGDYLVLE